MSTPTAGRIAWHRPFRSLRWRLQAWHAVVLTGVLTVFGLVVYVTAWQNRLQQIDAELDRTAEVITSRLRRLFPWPQPFRGPGRWPAPPRPESNLANRSDKTPPDKTPQRRDDVVADPQVPNINASRETREPFPSRTSRAGERPQNLGPQGESASRRDQTPLRRENSAENAVSALTPANENRGPRETTENRSPRPGEWSGSPMPPPGSMPPLGQWPTPSLGLPDEFLQLFEGDEETRLYFVIWDHQGKVLQKSDSAPEIVFPALKVGEDKLPVRFVRLRDAQREVIRVSSFDINLLVGRSIVKDLDAHHHTSLLRLVVGLAVLAAGLVGGWWSTSRAMRPIAAMTAAAESISAQRLSQRIDVQETDNELGQLAAVLNRTFDRLQASFEQQTRFTADASHELRTPLSVILAHADLALSRQRSPEEYRATLETCRSASRRMKSLIDGLLTLARFDSDASGLQFAEVDLESVARECIDLVRPLAAERQITMDADLKPTFLRGDRERLSQVITNLLTNAIRYNRDGGQVSVTVATENEAAVISVADTGIGIPADELPRIFDRFYRVDKARSRAEGSSGLGLSISKTIVTSHGGTIVAHSELDVGTTIEVRLPTKTSTPVRLPPI
ncbi:MAG: ATP-binding protein [Planctomycetota bacterium]